MNNSQQPPTLHLHIGRSKVTKQLEVVARATFEGRELPEAAEPFLWPELKVDEQGRSAIYVEEERGQRLWSALLPGRIDAKLEELRQLAGRTPCLIRLTIDRELTERADLENLPWEILCDPDTRQFLGQASQLALVRTAEKVVPCPAIPGAGPLRILIVAPAPADYHAVGEGPEIEEIRKIWRDRAHVFVMRNASFEDFCRKTRDMDRDGGVHIIHFIGHGGRLEGHDQGVLLFEDAGQGSAITATQIAEQMEGLGSLRLVVLNACRTFEPPSNPSSDPCRSPALEIARRKVPAVIGTSANIGIDLAQRFAAHLHRALAGGQNIDGGVRDARLALKSESRDRRDPRTGLFEWATPILYLTAPDGDLLRFEDPRGDKKMLRLGIRSRINPARGGAPIESDHLLDLVSYFDGRHPVSPAVWDEVLGKLWDFLRDYCGENLPVFLSMETHLSIAFAAGYLLNTRAPKMFFSQTTSFDLDSERAAWDPQKLWSFQRIDSLEKADDGEGSEAMALAVSVTRSALDETERYCLGQKQQRWRGLHAEILPEVGQSSVQGVEHMKALAKALVAEASSQRGRRDVHLFLVAPVTLAFQIGRLATQLGTIHLYEYDFGGKKGYVPSLVLTPEDQARRR